MTEEGSEAKGRHGSLFPGSLRLVGTGGENESFLSLVSILKGKYCSKMVD